MEVISSYERVEWLIDMLLARWRSSPKGYPFNRPDAIIPQTIIPDELRRDKKTLANWYLVVDEHMKGRVNSMEAFRGGIRIWQRYPWFYDPKVILWEKPSRMIEILEECLPTDKVNVVRDLRINFQHLLTYYDGSALNLIKGLTSYEEALRRILNKRTRGQRKEAGHGGEGLYGHRHKMVSMLLYFYDWEGWLKPRFVYPSPADIHNFRDAIAGKGLEVIGIGKDLIIRDYEKISAPWRAMVMQYIKARKEDPVDVADVLWLFSNLMCGNSPLTETSKKERGNGSGMFDQEELPHLNGVQQFLHPKYRRDLEATCLVCPLLDTCDFAIPARPYYDDGKLVLRPRPRIEDHIDRAHLKEPTYPAASKANQFNLFD